jgi:hypothetical protein
MPVAGVGLQEMEVTQEPQEAVVVGAAVRVRNGLQPQAVVALLIEAGAEVVVRVMRAREELEVVA